MSNIVAGDLVMVVAPKSNSICSIIERLKSVIMRLILAAIVANVAVSEVETPLPVIAFATTRFPSLTKPKGQTSPNPPIQAFVEPVTKQPVVRIFNLNYFVRSRLLAFVNSPYIQLKFYITSI